MPTRFSQFLSCIGLVLATIVASNSALSAQSVKPQISSISLTSLPRGCSYILDDWRGNILLWAPYLALNNDKSVAMIKLDGLDRSIPINSRSENHLSAFDGEYYLEVQVPSWVRNAAELRTARATLKVVNTQQKTQTHIIVRASEGC